MKQNIKLKKTTNKITALVILTGLLTGFLLSVMATMMYIGHGINWNRFFSPGVVYDFSQKDLKKSSSGWIYDEQLQGHWIQTDKSLKRYLLNGTERKWGYLYINVKDMSLPEVEGMIYYYNKEQEKVSEQPVVLYKGENVLILQEEIPMYKMGIRVLNAQGQFISIDSMQIRTKASGYIPQRFVKILTVSYCGFLLVFFFFVMWCRRYGNVEKKEKVKKIWESHLEILQYAFQLVGDGIEHKLGKRLTEKQRKSVSILLFCLLFAWLIVGNVLNWSSSREYYRYHVLVCVVLVIAIAALSWEKPLRNIKWNNPLIVSWVFLCIGMMISDVLVEKSINMVGAVMFFVGGYFIYIWGNMGYSKEVIGNILKALKIIFLIGTVYCMIFREKRLAIDYNGIFRSSEEFSMYAVLMFGVFLTDLDYLIKKSIKLPWKDEEWFHRKRCYKEYAISISGIAIAAYFIIRAGHITGMVTAIVVLLIFIAKQWVSARDMFKMVRQIFPYAFCGCIIGFAMVCGVHFATKYLPGLWDLDVEYKKETLVTGVSDELREAFNAMQPGLMSGVTQKEDMETLTVWKNYIRNWNLLGNRKTILNIFRVSMPAGNGYITMAYRYGMFILVPYIIWHVCLLGTSIKKCFGRRKSAVGIDADFWLLTVVVIFIGFSVYGNPEIAFGHPLWICMYLGTGFWFMENEIF